MEKTLIEKLEAQIKQLKEVAKDRGGLELLQAIDWLEDARDELKAGHRSRASALLQSALEKLNHTTPEIAHELAVLKAHTPNRGGLRRDC